MHSVLCAAALIVCAAAPRGKALTDDIPPSDRFTFSTGTCEQGPEFCVITMPRSWSPAEIDLVRAALDQIAASDVGRRITERALQNGFRTLRRYAHAAQLDDQGEYEVQPTIAALAHSDDRHSLRTIDLADQFFARESVHDHFSGEPGYLLTTEILAHELVHAMDLGERYSARADFRRVARLGMPAVQQREADRVNVERLQLNGEGRYDAAWQASRAFGVVRMRGRLPSVQALDSYREAFAEFGAHWILDPSAHRRFEPRLLRFFEQAVVETP